MLYDADNDPYLDKTSGILKNEFNIIDQAELDRIEAEITSEIIFTIGLEDRLSSDKFDWNYLQSLHRRIFLDIYEWVGEPRSVDIFKDSTQFAHYTYIVENADAIFSNLKIDNYLQKLSYEKFVSKITTLYTDLNLLHPFREGNGRTIRTFLSQISENAGWDIDWQGIDAEWNNQSSSEAIINEQSMRDMLSTIITERDPFWDTNDITFE